MPVNSYEVLFLLDPTKTATDMDGVKAQLNATIEKHGASIVASRKWDDNRKLAYPIGGHKKGVYHLTYFKADSRKISEMELDFRLSEVILRHLVSAIDPKWDEEMQAVAKDETRSALQLMHEEAPEGGGMGDGVVPGMEDGDGRPRRRRSPEADGGKD